MSIYEWAVKQTTPIDVIDASSGIIYGTYEYIVQCLKGNSKKPAIKVYDSQGNIYGYAMPTDICEEDLEIYCGARTIKTNYLG